MSVIFFAARSLHRDYFSQLAARLPGSLVLYYKFLWRPDLRVPLPYADLAHQVEIHLREKRNHLGKPAKSSRYWRMFRWLKTMEAKWWFRIYFRSFNQTSGSHVGLWNGLKFRQAIAAIAAKAAGKSLLFFENGLMPNCTTVDSQGINYLNSMPRHPQDYLLPHHQMQKKVSLTPSDDTQQEPYLFVPLQVNTDSQIVQFSPWLKDMRALVMALAECSNDLPERWKIKIKPHPVGETSWENVAEVFDGNSKLEWVTDQTTEELIHQAEAIATINSTVGIEAIVANKKVIVLGQAFYNIDELTLHAENALQLSHCFNQVANWQPNSAITEGFIRTLQQYQVKGRWQEADPQHLDAMVQRIQHLCTPTTKGLTDD